MKLIEENERRKCLASSAPTDSSEQFFQHGSKPERPLVVVEMRDAHASSTVSSPRSVEHATHPE